MKKSMLLVLLLSPILLFPQNMSNENQDFKDIVMKYAYQYLSPMHIKVLEENYCGPECYYHVNSTTEEKNRWVLDEISDEIVLREIEVGIHESTHGFCSSSSGSSMNFVVSDTRFISVPKTEIFKSNLIVNDMLRRNPKVENMFRFDTYVNTTRNMCSSTNGIYGLMNEYCAYYNGTSTALILYEVFKDKHSENEEEERSFRIMEKELAMASMSSVTAFYEFNSFIGAYLMYAKENNNEVYTEIINNSLLVESYSTVTYNFSVIAEEIHVYFPEHLFRLSQYSTCGSNETLLLSQEIFNDYIDVLNEFSNPTNLLLTKK